MQNLLHLITRSSVGRKFIMALTGIGAVGFLFAHLGGNLTIYGGPDALNAYAHKLHSIPILPLMSAGLALLFLIHIVYGVLLAWDNRKARGEGERYAVRNRSGKTDAVVSSTMIWSGVVVLVYMVYHVYNMKFAHGDIETYDKVADSFSKPLVVLFYVLGICAVGFHIYHGAASTLQSLGAKHPKYNTLITWAGRLAAIGITVGFASIPILFAIAPEFFNQGGLAR